VVAGGADGTITTRWREFVEMGGSAENRPIVASVDTSPVGSWQLMTIQPLWAGTNGSICEATRRPTPNPRARTDSGNDWFTLTTSISSSALAAAYPHER